MALSILDCLETIRRIGRKATTGRRSVITTPKRTLATETSPAAVTATAVAPAGTTARRPAAHAASFPAFHAPAWAIPFIIDDVNFSNIPSPFSGVSHFSVPMPLFWRGFQSCTKDSRRQEPFRTLPFHSVPLSCQTPFALSAAQHLSGLLR